MIHNDNFVKNVDMETENKNEKLVFCRNCKQAEVFDGYTDIDGLPRLCVCKITLDINEIIKPTICEAYELRQ